MAEYSYKINSTILAISKEYKNFNDCIIRAIDVIITLFSLIILMPLLPLISVIICTDSPGSPIFRQKRAGKNGVVFTMYKFRTMCEGADKKSQGFRNENEPVLKITEDCRITKVGNILRKFSIDEFPQFINVLKGDMSFVGPRPVVLKEYYAYNDYQKGRLAGKPGITGLAQINGRSDLEFDEIVKYDIYYNENRSVLLYLKVLFRTIPNCLFCKSSY
ncbi:sugar transferase [Candidatus Poribacteria bacterium]|nr:sugar transferase [Candidatus Poribacteria bacterium]